MQSIDFLYLKITEATHCKIIKLIILCSKDIYIPISYPIASAQTPAALCPDADQLAVALPLSSDRRPGSNTRTVLPPIPTERKSPAAPDPDP